MYEVEQLKKLRPYTTNIVVIENFNPKNDHHVHFAISLMSGRIVYDERKEKFEKLLRKLNLKKKLQQIRHKQQIQRTVLAPQQVLRK